MNELKRVSFYTPLDAKGPPESLHGYPAVHSKRGERIFWNTVVADIDEVYQYWPQAEELKVIVVGLSVVT